MKSLLLSLLVSATALLVSRTGARTIYEPYTFNTLAGYNGHGSADGTGPDAQFYQPTSAAIDHDGNVFVTDTGNFTIRRVTPTGVVTTFAGLAGESGSADGQGSDARFNDPTDIAIDRTGNLYVADRGNSLIRKISPDAVVTTLAGVFYPVGITVDRAGNVFVSDPFHFLIHKITPDGEESVFAGTGYYGTEDGTGTEASFANPEGLGIDQDDNIYVADGAELEIRKITPDAVVTHFKSLPVYTHCQDIAIDRAGNAFVADEFGAIVEIAADSSQGVVVAGYYLGSEDGKGMAAQFWSPMGITVDQKGFFYVVDYTNNNVRKINRQIVVTTLAGRANEGSSDAVGEDARFFYPNGVAADTAGTVYVADSSNQTIRKITPDGTVTTIAGKVAIRGSDDGPGKKARFNNPIATAVDKSGVIYVADNFNQTIRKITPDGSVTTLAGLAGVSGSADGTGSDARFFFPSGVAVDDGGYVYVADTSNYTIRKISPAGEVTTFAGSAGRNGSRNGIGPAAQFNDPWGVAVGTGGNVYVADRKNNEIRKITPDAAVTTLAGSLHDGFNDGKGTQASFSRPEGIAVDAADNIYIADTGDYLVRKITPDGQVTTLAGVGLNEGWIDGTGSDVRFSGAGGIAVDGQGNVFVADTGNQAIRQGFASSFRK